MTKNENPDEYSYSGYDIGFDVRGKFSLSNHDGLGKNVIIFGVDTSFLGDIDNRKKDILTLGKGPTDRVDDAVIIAEAEYSINFTELGKK